MNINRRLKTICEYVEINSNIIDVGCDHALLPIYLVLNNKCKKAIASDINKKPLEQAKKNIEYYDLNNKIKTKLGYGISTIDNNIDTIIISGMGGKNIIDILQKNADKLKNIRKIILSPNNNCYIIRKNLNSIGFCISLERIILEKNKFYTLIVLEKGTKKYNLYEEMFGYNTIKNNESTKYYCELKNKYKRILSKLPKAKIDQIKNIENYIEFLNENI